MTSPERAAGPGKAPHVTMSPDSHPIDTRSLPHATLAVDARGLALMLGCSERHVRALSAAGRLPRALRLGRRRVWAVATVEAWLAVGAPSRATWEASFGRGSAP
ncbi:MAG: helix-turn-helix domain-containing protein [Planctomycetes bacterium]|nr:helix-turn-helix domain-containing protein [Planctomycetota bacterium]